MAFRRGRNNEENRLSTLFVDAAYQVHCELGPGLLEVVYEVVLAKELRNRGLTVSRQVQVPIQYKGIQFDEGFRADLIVEDTILVELKSVAKLNPVYKKQVLTYLRMTNLKLGFLINYGEAMFRDGVHRIVNGLPE